MEFIIFDYEDPLFSIFVLGLVVVIVSFANRWFETFKNKDEKRKISKFVKNFNLGKDTNNYKKILEGGTEAVETLALSATIRSKAGEYEEAIKIYLSLLDILTDKNAKIDIMTMLGKTYFKAGFMQRSKDILLKALQLKPRNKDALQLLLIVYENLKNYTKALEVVAVLEELDVDVSNEKGILEILQITNNATLTSEKKSEQLLKYYEINPQFFRQVYEYLAVFETERFWQLLKDEEIDGVLDLLWNMEKDSIDFERVKKTPVLVEIYTAKDYISDAKKSSIFEVNTLIKLKEEKSIATLGFEYPCENCGNTFPMYFNRCPSCREVMTSSLDTVLEEARSESEFASAGFY
ncbi:MAG: hypothetical protein OIF32_06640 [Campylobacterales bacterium]|nr:hypothetical protein [Campylobacterales bacterium]